MLRSPTPRSVPCIPDSRGGSVRGLRWRRGRSLGAPRRRLAVAAGPAQADILGRQPPRARRHRELRRGPSVIPNGALCPCRDSPYKRGWARRNDRTALVYRRLAREGHPKLVARPPRPRRTRARARRRLEADLSGQGSQNPIGRHPCIPIEPVRCKVGIGRRMETIGRVRCEVYAGPRQTAAVATAPSMASLTK
jgi:hypothetical protein